VFYYGSAGPNGQAASLFDAYHLIGSTVGKGKGYHTGLLFIPLTARLSCRDAVCDFIPLLWPVSSTRRDTRGAGRRGRVRAMVRTACAATNLDPNGCTRT
jgi:hypothetical protein